MQDAQRMQVVHSSCNVYEASAHRILQAPCSMSELMYLDLLCKNTMHWPQMLEFVSEHLVSSRARALHRQDKTQERCHTRSRQPSSSTSFFCTSALSRLPLSAYSSSIHVSLISCLPPSTSGPFVESCTGLVSSECMYESACVSWFHISALPPYYRVKPCAEDTTT